MSERLRAWYLLLGLAILTLLLLSFMGRAPAGLSSAVALPQRLVYTVGSNLRTFLERGRARQDLHVEVARLSRLLAAADARNRQLSLANDRLQETMKLRAVQSPGVVLSAPVVSVAVSAVGATLELGLGSDDGIGPDMPVTVGDGLVGLVTEVASSSAWVRAVLDPASSVGVSVRGRGGQGVAVGQVGGLLRVRGYAEVRPVRPGDVVETSSRGGLFPRGIRVGRVVRVLPKAPNALYPDLLIAPGAQVGRLLEVSLIRPL